MSEIEDYKKDSLMRGEAFDEMTHSRGWELVKVYYENQIKSLANELLMSDKKPITDFEAKRMEVVGLRKLMGHVQGDIDLLYEERKANTNK